MNTSAPKFLKTLIVMICCLISTASYSQTKEETIAWLKEKLEKSLQGVSGDSRVKDIKVVNINECEFTIKYTYYNSNGAGTYWDDYYQQIIPTKGLTIDNYGRIQFATESIVYIELENKSRNTPGEKSYISSTIFFAIANRETDLHNRMLKAFNHLATFCPEKKETF